MEFMLHCVDFIWEDAMAAKRKLNTPEMIEEVVRRYRSGEAASAIARAMGCTQHTVMARLMALGIERHPSDTFTRRVFSPQEDRRVAERYRSGETADAIAESVGCDKSAVLGALRRAGEPVRNGGRPVSNITAEMASEMLRMYDAGQSRGAIARQFGLHDNAVKRILRTHARKIEARRGRENHHAWKGGAYIDNAGYRRIRLEKNDPFVSMCNSNDYVMEHRWVMAKALGRLLHDGESVHHVDGDRLNNELSNLQLRQGNHGKGARFMCLDCGSHNVKAVQLSTKES